MPLVKIRCAETQCVSEILRPVLAVHQSNGTSVTLDAESLPHAIAFCKLLDLSGLPLPQEWILSRSVSCKFCVKLSIGDELATTCIMFYLVYTCRHWNEGKDPLVTGAEL
jgi:hypothetical protein